MSELKEKQLCTSCKEEIGKQGIVFSCPNCNKKDIVRCLKCKKVSSNYTCENCEFVGP